MPSVAAIERKRERSRAWHKANPTYGRDWYRRKRREDPLFERRTTLRKYGLTLEQYDAMLKEQGGVCAICRRPETKSRHGKVFPLSVDHDRSCCPGLGSCGKCVRGLLCSDCNLALGKLQDDPGRALAIVSYLSGVTKTGLAETGKTHPPIADKLVMVDFDATIAEWGPLMGDKSIIPGAADAIRRLKDEGYRVGIFTSRLSRTWARSVVGGGPAVAAFITQQEMYVRTILDKNDIPFDFVTAEKMPAAAYIDDKAIAFRGDWAVAMEDSLIGR